MLRICSFLLVAFACFGQPPESWRFYKLDFVVKEVEGTKVLNSRTFSTVAQVDSPGVQATPGSIRTGSKVPAGNSYIDVGVNIDCRMLREVQGDLALSLTAEISSTAGEPTSPALPVVRQNKWSSYVIVALKKPTVIFSSDDATSKHTMQLELTATPINLALR